MEDSIVTRNDGHVFWTSDRRRSIYFKEKQNILRLLLLQRSSIETSLCSVTLIRYFQLTQIRFCSALFYIRYKRDRQRIGLPVTSRYVDAELSPATFETPQVYRPSLLLLASGIAHVTLADSLRNKRFDYSKCLLYIG